MDVVRALTICGGAARRPALAKLGVSDAALRRAVRAGILQPARGLYALPDAAPGDVTLLVRRQLLTCASAAPFYRLWTVGSSGPLHVHHSRGTAVEHQVAHRELRLPPHSYRPVTALGDVLIHALRCLPPRESLVMVECAVGRGDMTVAFLQELLPGKRNGKAREVLQWVDRGAESLLETLARTAFRQAGILESIGRMNWWQRSCPSCPSWPDGRSAVCRHAQPLFDWFAERVPRNDGFTGVRGPKNPHCVTRSPDQAGPVRWA